MTISELLPYIYSDYIDPQIRIVVKKDIYGDKLDQEYYSGKCSLTPYKLLNLEVNFIHSYQGNFCVGVKADKEGNNDT